ncbi:MAG: hypothetical protein ABI700_20625 [Chloroflexota bacterium]
MDTMRIERPGRRRTSLLPLACGCLAALGILSLILLLGAYLFLPQIIGRLTGLTPQGKTEAIFADVTPQPTVVLQNPTEIPQITIDLGGYGQQELDTDPQLYHFTLGTGTNGQATMTMTFTEPGLMQLCFQRSTVCGSNSSDPRFKNARIDLRPGGAVVNADVTLPNSTVALPAGVVVRWDSATRKIVFAGVDIGGTLYTTPPQSLADVIASVEQQMNDLIQQVAVDASGGRYTVSEVIITDTTATLILR